MSEDAEHNPAEIVPSDPQRFILKNRPFGKVTRLLWMNSGFAIIAFAVVMAIQLAQNAEQAMLNFVFSSPFTAGLFIPPIALGIWTVAGALQQGRRERETRLVLDDTRLQYTAPPAPLMLRGPLNVIIVLPSLEELDVKPTAFGARLIMQVSGHQVTVPLSKVTPEGDTSPPTLEQWPDHPFVLALAARSGRTPTLRGEPIPEPAHEALAESEPISESGAN